MESTALRTAYDLLLEVAAEPDLGPAADGGWSADQLLAHLISVDAGIAATTLAVVAGARPGYDNRISLDETNLARIVTGHAGRADLIDHVRGQAGLLADLVDRLSEHDAAVQIPVFLMSNGTLVADAPRPVSALITSLAEGHVPIHAQQLRDLRPPGPGAHQAPSEHPSPFRGISR